MDEWTDKDKAYLKLLSYLYPTYREEAPDLVEWHQTHNTLLSARADLAVQLEALQIEIGESLLPIFRPLYTFILNTQTRYRRWKDGWQT